MGNIRDYAIDGFYAIDEFQEYASNELLVYDWINVFCMLGCVCVAVDTSDWLH